MKPEIASPHWKLIFYKYFPISAYYDHFCSIELLLAGDVAVLLATSQFFAGIVILDTRKIL
jgi:hypothetical protein